MSLCMQRVTQQHHYFNEMAAFMFISCSRCPDIAILIYRQMISTRLGYRFDRFLFEYKLFFSADVSGFKRESVFN